MTPEVTPLQAILIGLAAGLLVVVLVALAIGIFAWMVNEADRKRHDDLNRTLADMRRVLVGVAHQGQRVEDHAEVLVDHAEILDELRPGAPRRARRPKP